MRCVHGYINDVAHNDFDYLDIKKIGKCYFLNYQKQKIIPCPKTIFCNNCEQMNMLGDILNDYDNVDHQEDYGYIGSIFKTALTIIYDYTKI